MKNNWKEQAHQEIERVFRVLLPQYGFAVREEQISLCHFMLDTLLQNHLALCDAGVGIGKTYAYLTACVMMQKFYPKNWNVPAQPVVISTSSIALQNAVMKEYIPFLSRVFLKHHILSEPIRAVVRKGKERFVCDIRLFQRLHAVREKKKNQTNLDALQSLIYHYDLDCVTGLSGFDRRMVCVPRACEKDCQKRNLCRYHQYLKEAKSKDIWIQVCNHNYLLADAAHRSKNLSPLLNDYGALIVDEAHKLPDAAQQMYGYRISPDDLEEICTLLEREKRLHASQRLREKFRCFLDTFRRDPCTEDMQRTDFCLTPQCKSALGETISLLHHTAKRLTPYLPRWMTHRLEETAKILTLFYTTDQQYVFYLEYGQQGIPTLCATSRNLPAQLRQALWEKKIPAVLTSGTLAAGQQFERTEQVLGLSGKQNVDSFTAVSPFDYEKNGLLYLPDHLDPSRRRIECLAKEIVRLVRATFGHTLVLFPSYSLMNAVYQQSKDRFTYPLLSVWRQSQNVISQFKQMPNAVLFAAGSCWEGVDFPGDMVSSLIIARLPFPVPDPLREAERNKYPSLGNTLVPNPEEIPIVEYIFQSYLAGKSIEEITRELNDAEVYAARKQSEHWQPAMIRYILRNEKYIGNSLLQKKFTAEELPFRRKANNGQVPKYYLENSHPAIISKEVFEAVQELLKQKSRIHAPKREMQQFPLSRMMKCGLCGSTFYRRPNEGYIRWMCYRHRQSKDLCKMGIVQEKEVYEAFLNLYHKLLEHKEEILTPMLCQLKELQGKILFSKPDVIQLNQQISELMKQNHSLSRLQSKGCIDSALFVERSTKNNQQLAELQEELRRLREPDSISEMTERTKTLLDLLEGASPMLEFDPDVFKVMITNIVIHPNKFCFHLVNGLILDEGR